MSITQPWCLNIKCLIYSIKDLKIDQSSKGAKQFFFFSSSFLQNKIHEGAFQRKGENESSEAEEPNPN